MIEVRNVRKSYGDVTALDGLSLSVEQNTTFGLLGTNGAGKTTLLKLLVGLDRPDSGDLTVAGADPTEGTHVRERVGYLPEHAGFPGSLSGREALTFHARMRGVHPGDRDRRVERVLRTVGLDDDADRRIAGYSNGMNRRLGLGTMLVADPQILLLDEPTAGLDPQGINAFHSIVERIAADTDVTIVFSGHALTEIDRLCDDVAIVDDGRVRRQGSVEELKKAVGDDVTVTVTFAGSEAAAVAVESLGDLEEISTVEQRGSGVEVSCQRQSAQELLARLHEVTAPRSFEVRQPDLATVFQDAVGTDSETDASPRSSASSPEPTHADGGTPHD